MWTVREQEKCPVRIYWVLFQNVVLFTDSSDLTWQTLQKALFIFVAPMIPVEKNRNTNVKKPVTEQVRDSSRQEGAGIPWLHIESIPCSRRQDASLTPPSMALKHPPPWTISANSPLCLALMCWWYLSFILVLRYIWDLCRWPHLAPWILYVESKREPFHF